MKRLIQQMLIYGVMICLNLSCGQADDPDQNHLNSELTMDSRRFTFPFSGPADAKYTEAPRSFGSCRSNCTRLHAAADLYGLIGRPIYAVGAGSVIDFHYFYDGTYALVVNHGDFIVRYGEIGQSLPQGIAVGSQVRAGQLIAYVGDLISLNQSMLHFERFSGKATGPLTVRDNPPYQRRSDLENPTADLIAWPYPL
ncbi:MAG: M23 family metallopeptidase [Oligoflexus sp.]